MNQMRDWNSERELWIRVLQKQTGEGLDAWNHRVEQSGIGDEASLRAWLAQRGITGYAQTLLVRERFGYPDFLRATGAELIARQYADRPQIQPIYDALITAAASLGEVTLQARKSYVSLVTPRRTFARIQATTRNRVDLGLRLEGQKPGGRLQPSKLHETMKLQISLTSPADVDAEVTGWLRTAYEQNC
jgi:hypothetical protein